MSNDQNYLPERSLESPVGEPSMLGAEIGVTESLKTNTQLIQHYLKGAKLRIKRFEIGKSTKTEVNIFYIDDIVDKIALNKILLKIESLQKELRYLIQPEVICEEISPKWKGLFSTIKITERFDVMVSDLLHGKIVMIADHTPIGYTTPMLFWEFFQSPDDYYARANHFSNRIVRMLCLFLCLYLPAIYVAIQKFHMNWFTSDKIKFLFNHDEILSPTIEMIFLLFVFRMASEASTRIYKTLPFFIAILVTLIVGQMAVESKFINPFAIMVASISQLSIYLNFVKGLLGFAITGRNIIFIASVLLGFKGIIVISLIFLVWASCIKPFGIPYLSPVIPFKPRELKDIFFRGNLKKMINSIHSYREK